MSKKILVSFGIDIDAVAGWLGSYGGADSPNDIQRGIFAGEVGIPRLLKLFSRHDLRTTWFIPGHSLETFPDQCRAIVDAGHEVGGHGYSHENPVAMTPQQEHDVVEKATELLTELAGKAPRGYTAPWWEMSSYTPTVLKEFGYTYDHSQSHKDFVPWYSRVGEKWTPIDYTRAPEYWMKPLEFGREIDLVEVAANWYVDDLPPMMFIKSSANSHGFVSPNDIEQLWKDQFDWVYRELDYAVFPITIHPDVSGRPQVLLMLERLINYMKEFEGVEFTTMGEIADDFRRRFPFEGTERPRDY
ncbi:MULTISPECIES: polysaccharide deacetylase family protein [Corynebacterium]|uniref:Peptidoglycan deacetylase n=1 Tax=Corynebacterium provencense TaxID=1737425 RepID=A0A2Z3YNP9_9CORY|nr:MULTISPECIES: polysaccharide deacetylase [Corynebacterium]AWT24871.1 Peptidoglycan deacetylase [Corynebacterium provencense]MCI1255858.1 polysaccharide deacetylase [Corynebacterium provencense]